MFKSRARSFKRLIKKNSSLVYDVWDNRKYVLENYLFEEQIKTGEIFVIKVDKSKRETTIARYDMGEGRMNVYEGYEEDVGKVNELLGITI